jgi:hypothetical protein
VPLRPIHLALINVNPYALPSIEYLRQTAAQIGACHSSMDCTGGLRRDKMKCA